MVKIFFLIALLPVLVLGVDYNFKECEGAPIPLDITIEECPNGAPCAFKPDQIIHFRGKVLNDHVIKSAKFFAELIKANGEIVKLDAPFEDACAALIDAKCPAQPGTHEFHGPIHFKGISPGEDVTLKVHTRDQDDKVLGCVSMEIKF